METFLNFLLRSLTIWDFYLRGHFPNKNSFVLFALFKRQFLNKNSFVHQQSKPNVFFGHLHFVEFFCLGNLTMFFAKSNFPAWRQQLWSFLMIDSYTCLQDWFQGCTAVIGTILTLIKVHIKANFDFWLLIGWKTKKSAILRFVFILSKSNFQHIAKKMKILGPKELSVHNLMQVWMLQLLRSRLQPF